MRRQYAQALIEDGHLDDAELVLNAIVEDQMTMNGELMETLLHYRTPTEPGNSGSPVFESERWRVVALHHGGGSNVPSLDGVDGTYEANEGIAIRAIRKRIQNG